MWSAVRRVTVSCVFLLSDQVSDVNSKRRAVGSGARWPGRFIFSMPDAGYFVSRAVRFLASSFAFGPARERAAAGENMRCTYDMSVPPRARVLRYRMAMPDAAAPKEQGCAMVSGALLNTQFHRRTPAPPDHNTPPGAPTALSAAAQAWLSRCRSQPLHWRCCWRHSRAASRPIGRPGSSAAQGTPG